MNRALEILALWLVVLGTAYLVITPIAHSIGDSLNASAAMIDDIQEAAQ